MNNVTNVFVNGAFTLTQLVSLISSLLGVVFQRKELDLGILYSGNIEEYNILVEVFDEHGLVNDGGINFEEFDYQVSFESDDRGSDLGKYRTIRKDLAITLVDSLKTDIESECIVVEGLQKIVDVR